jgi:hypothetical protein
MGDATGQTTAQITSEPVGEPGTHGGPEMSLFDIAGDYQSQTIDRPAGRGLVSLFLAALRRPHDLGTVEIVEDAVAAKHRRRERGYLADVGI